MLAHVVIALLHDAFMHAAASLQGSNNRPGKTVTFRKQISSTYAIMRHLLFCRRRFQICDCRRVATRANISTLMFSMTLRHFARQRWRAARYHARFSPYSRLISSAFSATASPAASRPTLPPPPSASRKCATLRRSPLLSASAAAAMPASPRAPLLQLSFRAPSSRLCLSIDARLFSQYEYFYQ